MKILLGGEELEIIESETNQVVFYTDGNDDIDEDDIDEDEDLEEEGALPLMYEVNLYKNTQAQQIDKTIVVKAYNMRIKALTETSSVLFLLNQYGQAVYSVAWELVHSINACSEPKTPTILEAVEEN